MKTQTVFTEDYILLLDEEKICKTGELYLTSIRKIVKSKSKDVIQAGDKILAYYKLNPQVPDLDLPELPDWREEVEKHTNELYLVDIADNNWCRLGGEGKSHFQYKQGFVHGYIDGFKACQELQKDKLFTLEDVEKAFNAGHERGYSGYPNTENWSKPKFEEILQQLQRPKLPKEYLLGKGETIEEQIKNGKWCFKII